MATRTKARRCGEKMRHRTEAAAEVHRARLIRRFAAVPEALEVYLCTECDRWHVGHVSLRQRRRRRPKPDRG